VNVTVLESLFLVPRTTVSCLHCCTTKYVSHHWSTPHCCSPTYTIHSYIQYQLSSILQFFLHTRCFPTATVNQGARLTDYNVVMVWDNNLFNNCLNDFEGWTKAMFLKVERHTLKLLKTILQHRGVYKGNNRAKIVDSIYIMVDLEDALK
jgi:hypothetical protein